MDTEKEVEPNSKGRPRGRPRKESQDDPIGGKRARGREAQKNYQLRKQAETSSLKKRIAFLEDAVEKMSSDFVDFGARVVTSEAHTPVLDDLRAITERFLKIARAAESLAGDHESQISSYSASEIKGNNQEPRRMSTSDGAATPKPDIQNHVQGKTSIPTLNPELTTRLAPATPTAFPISDFDTFPYQSDQTGSYSPYFGYGLLSVFPKYEPFLESVWSHYLVAGPDSFAMRLYLDGIKLVLKALKGEVSLPGFLASIGRFRFRYEDPSILISILDEQFANLKLQEGKVEVKSASQSVAPESKETSVVLFGPSHPLMSTTLRRNIFADATREMGSIKEWLDPWSVQQYLTSQWGMQLTSASAQISTQILQTLNMSIPEFDHGGYLFDSTSSALGGIHAPSLSQPTYYPQVYPNAEMKSLETIRHFNLVVSAGPLAQLIIQDAVCFGEGPRFLQSGIDKAVLSFLSGLASTEGMLAIPIT